MRTVKAELSPLSHVLWLEVRGSQHPSFSDQTVPGLHRGFHLQNQPIAVECGYVYDMDETTQLDRREVKGEQK